MQKVTKYYITVLRPMKKPCGLLRPARCCARNGVPYIPVKTWVQCIPLTVYPWCSWVRVQCEISDPYPYPCRTLIFGKPWTARDVYRVRNEVKLKKKTTEQHGQLPGTAQFVGQYQQMISEDFNKLQEEDPSTLHELEEEAELWNRERPPKEQQRK
jgi:hypothetical protein